MEPRAIGFLEDDGWHCHECHPPLYMGRTEDIIRHCEDNHKLERYTVDVVAGILWDGLLEMA